MIKSDFSNNIITISNSILKYYGVEPLHETNKYLDEILSKKGPSRKICLFLLDGYGTYIQENFKDETPLIYKNKKFEITSVFPPSTVPSTTGLLSATYPCENGYLAWTRKFKEFDTPITVFPSTYIGGDVVCSPRVEELLPYKDIFTMINEKGKYKALEIKGLDHLYHRDVNSFFKAVNKGLKRYDFTYAYWVDPDATLHEKGTKSPIVGEKLHILDEKINKLAKENKDVTFVILADHGHIDAKYYDIEDYPDVLELLSNPYLGLEPRCPCFYVSKENKEILYNKLKDYFGQHFDVFYKEEVLQHQLFGKGKFHPSFEEGIGDILMVSNDEWCLAQKTNYKLVSAHSGGTKDEMYINVAILN